MYLAFQIIVNKNIQRLALCDVLVLVCGSNATCFRKSDHEDKNIYFENLKIKSLITLI